MDITAAASFLDALSGEADGQHTFQLYHDTRQSGCYPSVIPCARLSQIEAKLQEANNSGYGIFYMPQRTNLCGRKKTDVVGARALFVDSDGNNSCPLPVPVPPSARVYTRPGREHVYWFLHHTERLEDVEPALKQLARFCNTDSSVAEIARVLRLPGSYNNKETTYLTTLQELYPDRRYTVAQVLEGWLRPESNVVQFADYRYQLACAEIASSSKGERNSTLYKHFFVLKDFIRQNQLDGQVVIPALIAAAQRAGLPQEEAVRTLRSAYECGVVSDIHTSSNLALQSTPEPTSAPTQQGMVFNGYGDADLADFLLREMGLDQRHLRIADGIMFRYMSNGVWKEVPVRWLKGRVQQYHGGTAYTPQGEIKTISVTPRKRDAVIDLALHDARAQWEGTWGQRAGLLCRNGYVQSVQGQWVLSEPSPEQHNRALVDIPFEAQAECPKFHTFLHQLFPSDARLSQLFQEFIGASLLGMSVLFGKCLILLGEGSNGKSALLQAITDHLFPPELVTFIPPGRWNHEYYLYNLHRAQLNVVGELPSWKIVDADIFKSVITGDSILARPPYGQVVSFRPRAGHVFATNELPATRDYSLGFWRRFLVLPFLTQFDGSVAVPEILARFQNERPGILWWALEGATRLLQQRRYTSADAQQTTQTNWRMEADPVAGFLHCCTTPSDTERTQAASLYMAFTTWCGNTGRLPVNSTRFGRRIKSAGVKTIRNRQGVHYLVRIRPQVEWEIEVS